MTSRSGQSMLKEFPVSFTLLSSVLAMMAHLALETDAKLEEDKEEEKKEKAKQRRSRLVSSTILKCIKRQSGQIKISQKISLHDLLCWDYIEI